MFHLFGFLLFFLLIIVVVGVSLVGGVLRLLFGGRRKGASTGYGHYTGADQAQHTDASSEASSRTERRKKIFGDDEGEYVDYEEVK